jgi:tRNA pseudouridine55 synthase
VDSYILPYDKPVGPTSHDIVARMRRELGEKRIGHTGTLDPFASGLLLLCVGEATRLAEYLSDMPKSYVATARFDGSTATDDGTSPLQTQSDNWKALKPDTVRALFERQVGVQLQMPSSFSAKKVDGERAYEVARSGREVKLQPKQIEIFDLRVRRVELPEVEFEVDCSSGTYVRAIARDIGQMLGTGGYLTALRRTAIGGFDMSRVGELISMLEAIAHMPRFDVSADQERAIRFGQALLSDAEHGAVALVRGDTLVAIAQSDGQYIKPKKVFSVG